MDVIRDATHYDVVKPETAATLVLVAGPCQLCRIIATGAPAPVPSRAPAHGIKPSPAAKPEPYVFIYDSGGDDDGPIVFAVPTSVAAGTIYDLRIPMSKGIKVAQVAHGPGLCVTRGH